MNTFGILGLTYENAEVESMGRYARPAGPWLAQLKEAAGLSEFLYLATCNRLEFLYCSEREDPVADIFAALKTLFPLEGSEPEQEDWRHDQGEAAVCRLLQIVSGLDSLVFGDAQILGQFRHALADSLKFDTSGRWIRMLGDEAMRTALKVRQELDFGQRPTSIPEVAVRILREAMQGKPKVRLVLVGAGKMIRKAATRLKGWNRAEILFVNRTPERARALAKVHGVQAMSLAEFHAETPDFDALISATATDQPVLTCETFRKLPPTDRPRLLLDMGLPANIEPELGQLPGFMRCDVLQIGREANGAQLEVQALRAQAAPILDHGLEVIHRRAVQLELSPAAASLRNKIEQRAMQELARWMEGPLAHLSHKDRLSVEGLARRLAAQTVQLPLVSLHKMVGECSCGGAKHAALDSNYSRSPI